MEAWRNIGKCSIELDLRVLTLGYFDSRLSNYDHIAVNSLLLVGKLCVFLQNVKIVHYL
jgi:hypothetical protein